MGKIISEVSRIQTLMDLKKTKVFEQVESHNVNCDNFDFVLFDKIMRNNFIFKFNETPLKDIWDIVAKKPSLKQTTKLNKGLDLLQAHKGLGNLEREIIYNESVNSSDFILDKDGNWLLINKLTGNPTQFRHIISEIISLHFNEPKAKEMYCKIISGENPNTVINKEFRTYIKNKITLGWLKNQTDDIKSSSLKGEIAENDFKSYLKDKYKTEPLYTGGDGDLFDINLSIDLIVDIPNYGVKTIQIKNNREGVDKMMKRYEYKNNSISTTYKFIDWVVYPSNGEWYYINPKDPSKIHTI